MDYRLLEQYITLDEPLGPIDAQEMSKEVLEILFEQHNRMYKYLRKRPSVILGRRGAGKTSYLRAVYFDTRYNEFIEINTPQAFLSVASSVQDATQGAVFPEIVADMWDAVVWIQIFSRLLEKHKGLSRIKDYLAKIGVREHGSVDEILWDVADVLKSRTRENIAGVVAEILTRLDNITFNDAKEEAANIIRRNGIKLVVMMDSLDDFSINIDTIARSLQGLMKYVGGMNSPRSLIEVRFCLPSELYHKFLELSSNPLKDFRRILVLQWTATELIMLGAQRLLIFLAIHFPEIYRNCPHSINKRKDAMRLFHEIFPAKIKNEMGYEETTLGYILRHTQLLPRHFLMILNEIVGQSVRRNSTPKPTGEEVVRGVSRVEERLVQEIFQAYRPIYPKAREVCRRCIPELPHMFSIGDLHRVFTKYGKKAMESDDFFDFKRMLIEMGIIGRVIEVTDMYVKGLFEYTVPHELLTSTDDKLCVHPLFSGVFGRRNEKPVYPYGSMLEDKDYRDW